ncbi:hypothetical protein [Sorangium sp. So ce887]|uniref:hypothetical protein n=1 Tax=Sorangium sp. So ce887 TaxID=3133324 RepID=UPI003F634261
MITAIDRRAVVRTLSVRGSGQDALTARVRAEQLLGAVDLHPPSLPPAAILCVRRLRDPRPGALTLDGRSPRPPRVWEEALSAALEAVVRRAARPWQGSVGASAEAVIFADRSELLACLAVDLVRDDLGARWWWASLVPDHRAPRSAVAAWVAAPEHVPGALHLLAERREIEPFAGALTLDEARTITRAVAERFGARAVAAAIEGAEPRADPTRVLAQHDIQDPADEEPWVRWAPELRGAPVDGARRALVGFGLALHRAPSAARSMAFAAAVVRWSDRVTPDALADDAPRSIPPEPTNERLAPTEATTPCTHEPATTDVAALRADEEPRTRWATTAADLAPQASVSAKAPFSARDGKSPRAEAAAPDDRAAASPATTDTAAPHVTSRRAAAAPSPGVPSIDSAAAVTASPGAPALSSAAAVTASPNDASAIICPAPTAELPPPLPPAELPPALSERPPRRFSAPIVTDFGGVFFLVNLALYLDLYSDFSAPLHPGIDLPIWDFLALVGRDLAGDALLEDPVWPLLAELAGRGEDTAPGIGFTPPDAWRVPPAWLRAFPEPAAWSWATHGDHLTIRHPAGFDVVEVVVEGDPAAQARREASGYGAIEIAGATAPLTGRAQTSADRWLARILPYVRARLARALGATVEEHPGRRLCALPAHIHVTATHLDVTMSLAELPIEVRLAALDRDPGWVPAAGRYVAFHFE